LRSRGEMHDKKTKTFSREKTFPEKRLKKID